MKKTYRIKLTDFEIRVLIHVLADYRNELISAHQDTTDINNLLLRILDLYDPV